MSNPTYRRLSRILLIAVLSIVIGISILTGSVAGQEYFEAEINYASPDPINASEDLIVNVTIKNTGSNTGSQNITLTDANGDDVVETSEIQVSNTTNSNTKNINITWKDDFSDREVLEPIVKTENATQRDGNNTAAEDQVTPGVRVLYSTYDINEITTNRTPPDLSSGEKIEFSATVENTGTADFSQKIYLNRSEEKDNKTISIGRGGTNTITFNTTTVPSSPDEYEYTVNTIDDESDQDVIVSGNFTVEDLDGQMDGQNLTIEAELGKLGSHTDTQPVNFSARSPFSAQSPSINFTETETVSVTGTTESVTFEKNISQKTFDGLITVTTNRAPPDGQESKLININDRINLGPGNFSINRLKSTDKIAENGNLTVTAEIENVGKFNATQTVELVDNETGDLIQEKEVLINTTRTTPKDIELYWDPVPSLSERRIKPEVRTENDSETRDYVTLQPQSFEIEELTVNRSSVSTEEGLTFNATVRNRGTKQAQPEIELIGPAGNQLNQTKTTINATGSKVVTLTAQSAATPGEKQYTVRNGTSEATASVTVGDFNVEIESVNFEGSNIRVDGEVSKLGEYTSTQPLELTVDGNTATTQGRNPRPKTVDGTSPTDVEFIVSKSSVFRSSRTADVTLNATNSNSIESSDSTTIEKFTATGPNIINVADTVVQSGDTVEFTYTAAGQNVDSVEVSVTDPNGDTVISGQSLTPGKNETGTITVPDRDAIIDGGYDLQITITNNIPGNNAQKTDTVTGAFVVSNRINPEAIGVLDEPVIRTPAGDFATIPTGGQYMLIGGNRYSGTRQQYLDILHVSEGSTTLNTRYLGTNVNSSKAYGEGVTSLAHSSIGADAGPGKREGTVFEDVSFMGDASSLAEFRDNIGIDARSAPVQAGRYRLVAGENGQVTMQDSGDVGFTKSIGRSNLVLTQTQRIGPIKTYTLPPGRVDETEIGDITGAPESDTVAVGDRLAIEVPATGMWGATLPDGESEPSAEQIARMLSEESGIRITLTPREQFNDPNTGAESLQFDDVSADDVAVLADRTTDLWENETTVGDEPSIGGYYIVIDTGTTLSTGDAYMTFEMAYESPSGSSYQFESYNLANGAQPEPFSQVTDPVDGTEHYPYFGDSDTTVRENTTILFQEPSVQYDRVMPDGEVIVPAQSDGRVFGSTTLAPESEVAIEVISDDRPNPDIVAIEEITIGEDRRFDVSADFSQLSPGQSATIEFYAQNRLEGNRLIDAQEVNVVDDIENPAAFEIQSLPTEVTVKQRESLDEIAADIQNTGSISGRDQVEFWINDESIKNETLTLPSGVNETVSLSEQFVTLPVGTYPYTVRTEDDETTGQLTVEPPESGTTITETDSSSAASSSPVGDENPSDESGGDPPSSGLFSLVGVSGRDVALGAALTGVAHVLGYWA